ncbi:MAG: endo-arabinase [Bacteroidetes bacterium]|nr:endo-arabinase [Bacteroidota bacterium]
MKKIILFLLITASVAKAYAQTEDESAIKQVLEKESATWRSGDVKGHAACWVIRPYSRILVSAADGKVFDVAPEMMIHPPAGMMGKGGSAVNTNYKMHISGNNAWVSHNEESTAADGSKTYSYEFRMLEKIDGQWKLVAQSIHLYKPE